MTGPLPHLIFLLYIVATAGCEARTNPSFPLSAKEAKEALAEMRKSPRALQRPLVILGGFTDVGFGTHMLRSQLASMFDDRRVLLVTFADCVDFNECRERVIEAVDQEFGAGDNAAETVEVDVIGQSMGGLVALIACSDSGDGGRRLNVVRLFALSSPLQGAKLAAAAPVVLTDMHRDMRPGSELYQHLAKSARSAEVYCYTRLGDRIVGEAYAAPAGATAWWLDAPSPLAAHAMGVMDKRALADIARRLRGEPAYATLPPAPLPGD